VQVAGKNLDTLTNWRVPAFRQKLGVVFQNFRLLQNKTVYENVAFALKVIGKPKHTILSLVPEALKIVGLEDKADRMPYELSGGEQQRVAIARAFVNRPLIILADEPTGNLDPTTSLEIMQVFEMISNIGTTIVMATHSQDIVNSMKKRVIELRGGKVVRDEKNAQYEHLNIGDGLDFGADAPINPPAAPSAVPQKTAESTAIEEVQDVLGVGADISADVALDSLHPEVEITANSTVRIPRVKRAVGSNLNNSTVRIPKLPRVNEFAIKETDDAYQQYYEQPDDLFSTGSFDASPFRNKGDKL
jgi:cell division transport system ATP-binding protein